MSVHVRFETPQDLADKVYELVQTVGKSGAIKKGSNEVTKAAERGNAKFIVLAEDVNPPELLAHIPMICDEKNIHYGYVPSQEFLAKEAGMPKGVKTASLALMEISKAAQENYNEIIEQISDIKE
ncbi:MAG: ribosomal L7Ae/L30e/S12e/Gadd45 family protein [Candidatus Poseidoniaceae archaeon]|jgi:large subunit ribosomal protein L7Ae|nr:ribosomal L7Ae/L30e/S12e/Gadd45 family protein [Candidatus Poseidoniaceae archaeon]MDP7202614.1 ribosomal L7Ae/L30e/S12e/Gadd45 family protein [Candidatus Poseidoniaceae archaeon]